MANRQMVTATKAAIELVPGDRVMVGMGNRAKWEMVPAVVVSSYLYSTRGVSIELVTESDHFWLVRNIDERLEIA